MTGALGHTNPKVKEDLLNWLKEEITSSPRANKAILPKLAPAILPQAAKCAEDAVPAVREAAIGFLSGFAARVRPLSSIFLLACINMRSRSLSVDNDLVAFD